MRVVFLDASLHLCGSGGPSVGPSVRPFVRDAFVKNKEDRYFYKENRYFKMCPHKSLTESVRPLVGPSVGPSVTLDL